jgi:hypothetical protein
MTGEPDQAALRLWRSLCLGDAAENPPVLGATAGQAGEVATEPQAAGAEIERLAQMLYEELDRHLDRAGPSTAAIVEAGSLFAVLIEGRIDLVRVAAALTRRLGLRLPEGEARAKAGPPT